MRDPHEARVAPGHHGFTHWANLFTNNTLLEQVAAEQNLDAPEKKNSRAEQRDRRGYENPDRAAENFRLVVLKT